MNKQVKFLPAPLYISVMLFDVHTIPFKIAVLTYKPQYLARLLLRCGKKAGDGKASGAVGSAFSMRKNDSAQ